MARTSIMTDLYGNRSRSSPMYFPKWKRPDRARMNLKQASDPAWKTAQKKGVGLLSMDAEYIERRKLNNQFTMSDPLIKARHKAACKIRSKDPAYLEKVMASIRKGTVYSKKNKKFFDFASYLERDWILKLDDDDLVRQFLAQPEIYIKYRFGGQTRTYMPDLFIENQDGSKEVVEVKPESKFFRNHPRNLAKWDAARKWCKMKGRGFRIVGYKELKNE